MNRDEARELQERILQADGWQNVMENTIDWLRAQKGLEPDSCSLRFANDLDALLTRYFGARV